MFTPLSPVSPLALLPVYDGNRAGFSFIWKILLRSFLAKLPGVGQGWSDGETVLRRIWGSALEA